ncbi:MAG: diphthine synthase [Candidatus Woesearchaeota archaeon]
MALFLIGIGLGDADDITLKGLELLKQADKVYFENYTSVLNCDVKELEKVIGKTIETANREVVEKKAEATILQAAKDADCALLVIGDPLVATTHIDLLQRAKKEGITVKIIHNASIISAIGATGLQVYKFGKTTSIPFPTKEYMPETPYLAIEENQKIGAHTLLLLDLKPEENKFMTINDAIDYLLKIELKLNRKVFTRDTLCIGCARVGAKDQLIKAGTAKDLLKIDFGRPVHCLVVPAKLHFMEEEFLSKFR